MNFRYFLLFIAYLIFLFSGNFATGIENAFGFLFWINLIILLPVIFIWTLLQFVAFGSLFSSPAGVLIAPLISLIGWWLLLIYGVNAMLCWFISANVEGAASFLALPMYTQIAIAIFIALAIFSPKLKKFKTMGAGFKARQEPKSANEEVIIDAEIIEHNEQIEHRQTKV
jgi:hypothetical protein